MEKLKGRINDMPPVYITNICIQMGLKGGHFFPVIFSGVCLGYGLAMLVFPEAAGHVVFAAVVGSKITGNKANVTE